jgi:hypothetical protein
MVATSQAPILRSMRLGQILDRAIRLYRANFVTFIGIIAVMLVPMSLLTLAVQVINAPAALAAAEAAANLGPNDNPFTAMGNMMSASTGGGWAILLALINGALVGVVATSAMVRAAASANLGTNLTIGQAYSFTRKDWWNVLVAGILFSFLLIGLFVWAVVPCVGWLTGFGLILFFTTAVRPLVVVAIVLEGQNPIRAIRRAWDLTRRRFWWTLGFMFVLGLFSYAVVAGPSLVAAFLLEATVPNLLPDATPATLYTVQVVSQSVSSLVLNLLYFPLQLAAVIVLYFDLRVRTEGLDLAYQAASTGGELGDPMALLPQHIPADDVNLVTMQEMAYFAGISISVVFLYMILVGVVFLISFMALLGGAR